MSVKDKLQIILITYNRARHVQKTFEQILSEESPVRDYDILLLDNNSTDNTYEVFQEWNSKFPNLRYQKNKYNLGISGNIARAMEIADNEYVWIICDDDRYDWSNWSEVETAIENGEKALCVSRYGLNTCSKAELLGQMTFIPANIFKTSIFTDTVMRNVLDTIYTLMPHLCPIIDLMNKGEKIYVVEKAIVTRHDDGETDNSYVRGNRSEELFPQTKNMSWVLGYANVLAGLNDKKLIDAAMLCAGPGIHFGKKNFYVENIDRFFRYPNFLLDIFLCLNTKHRLVFAYYYLTRFLFRYTKLGHKHMFYVLGIKITFNFDKHK